MNQTRLESGFETAFNVVIGFSINYFANIILIPQFATDGAGHAAHLSFAANWWMGCLYTVISVARSYTIRRWFNAGLHKAAAALALRVLRWRAPTPVPTGLQFPPIAFPEEPLHKLVPGPGFDPLAPYNNLALVPVVTGIVRGDHAVH